jgi:hypothetical protein
MLKAAAMVQPIKEEVFKNVDVVASDDGEVVLVKDCTTCTAWRCRDLDLEQCAQWKPDITQPSKLMGILCCDPVVAVVAVAVTVLEQEVVCIQQDGQQWVPVFSPALRPYDGVLNFKTATNRVCVRTLYGCAVYATPASRTHFHVQYTFDLQGFFPRMLWFPCSDQIVVLFSAEEDHAMRMQVNTWEDGSGFAKGPCITLPVANYFRVAMGLRNTVLAAFFGLVWGSKTLRMQHFDLQTGSLTTHMDMPYGHKDTRLSDSTVIQHALGWCAILLPLSREADTTVLWLPSPDVVAMKGLSVHRVAWWVACARACRARAFW